MNTRLLLLGGASLLAVIVLVAFGAAFLGAGTPDPADPGAAQGKPLDWDPQATADWEARKRAQELTALRDERSAVANAGPRAAAAAPDESGYEPVTWSDLAGFPYSPSTPGAPAAALPESVTRLSGKKCRVTGFMMPTQMSGSLVKSFLLTRTQPSCCFAQQLSLQEWIAVQVEPGVEIKPEIRAVTVLGTFEAGEETSDGSVASLYRMKATQAAAR